VVIVDKVKGNTRVNLSTGFLTLWRLELNLYNYEKKVLLIGVLLVLIGCGRKEYSKEMISNKKLPYQCGILIRKSI